MEQPSLSTVNDQNLELVLGAETGVLILTRSDCGYCARYQDEILRLRDQGKLQQIVIAKLVLDRPGSSRFKRENPWLAGLDHLPHTLVYRKGERVDEFSASKGSYLLERIEELAEAQPSSGAS